jgi:hypothetical protein
MDLKWVRKPGRSWHIIEVQSDRAGVTHTLCGRKFGGVQHTSDIIEWAPTLGDGRSCESCLRIQARHADR